LELLLVSIIFCHSGFFYFPCSSFMYGMWAKMFFQPLKRLLYLKLRVSVLKGGCDNKVRYPYN